MDGDATSGVGAIDLNVNQQILLGVSMVAVLSAGIAYSTHGVCWSCSRAYTSTYNPPPRKQQKFEFGAMVLQ